MRVGLQAREVGEWQRKDATLIFAIDVSGSMGREDRLGLMKRSLALLVDELGPRDAVGIVVYGSRGRVVLRPTDGGERGAIMDAINSLNAGGSTYAEEGLRLAYEMAANEVRSGRITRVLLLSDGVGNVGRTSADAILEQIRSDVDRGVTLTTVGFGMGQLQRRAHGAARQRRRRRLPLRRLPHPGPPRLRREPHQHHPDRRQGRQGAGGVQPRRRQELPPPRLREQGRRRRGLPRRHRRRRRDRREPQRHRPLRTQVPRRRCRRHRHGLPPLRGPGHPRHHGDQAQPAGAGARPLVRERIAHLPARCGRGRIRRGPPQQLLGRRTATSSAPPRRQPASSASSPTTRTSPSSPTSSPGPPGIEQGR